MQSTFKLSVFALILGLITAGSVVLSTAHVDAATCDPERDLSGQLGSNGSGTITNRSTTCTYKVGLAAYKKFDENINNQELFSSSVKDIGPNRSMTLTVSLPSCAYQLDLFYGNLITDYSNGARYGDRLLAARHAGGDYCGNNNFTVSCAVSDTSVTTGTTVTYTANAVGGSAPYTYKWTGTDGLSATTRSVNKTYTSVGNKTATVEVTSGTKKVTKTCSTVVVTAPPQDITGSCTVNKTTINEGESVTYTANASGGNGSYTYNWTGPEGLSATTRTVTKTYNDAGTKTARVTVSSNNRSVSFVCPVVVVNQTGNNDFTGSCSVDKTSIRVGETVRYSATANGGTGNFSYVFTGSEGLNSTSNPTSKTYNSEGTKNAQVRITSGSQAITKTCPVVVVDEDPAFTLTCTASPTQAEIGDTVTFTARPQGGSGNYTYSWSNAGSGTNRTSVQSFNSAGTKTATVYVNDGNQTKSASCSTVIEEPTQGLSGSCVANPTNAKVGQSINFSANATGGSGGYTYSWTGLESSFASQSFNTSFSSEGTKNVRVTISSNGQSITRSCPVNIEEENNNQPFSISCDVSPSNPEVDENVNWSVDVNGGSGNFSYRWTGDATGNTRTVTESYDNDGDYDATIRVTDNDSGQSQTRTCSINVDEEEEEDDLDVSCSVSDSRVKVGEDVTFSARVDGGNSPYDYEWDIDDHGDEDDRTVRVSFDSPGRKYAEVTVEDDDGEEDDARCSVLVEDDDQNVTVVTEDVPTQSYVYLNQVPYTGAGDKLKLISLAVMLAFWSVFIAYMIIRKRARKLAMGYIQQ